MQSLLQGFYGLIFNGFHPFQNYFFITPFNINKLKYKNSGDKLLLATTIKSYPLLNFILIYLTSD